MIRHLGASAIVLCAAITASAASPALNAINPRGGQRGTDVTLTFSGGRLADAQEVLVYYPSISITKLEVVNDATLKVTAKIASDCRLGEHCFRVRCASGISEMRTFWVGALPCIDEKEPNSDFALPQKIPLNVTVHGVVDTEDVDYFAVDMKKGQRLSVEIEGMRLGGTLFDPYIAILDSKRFELARSDDAANLGQDGCASIIVPADGTYIVQVRESAYGGNGACQYRLHVGTFPRPTGVVPSGGKLGEEVEVTFLGDPTGPIKQKIKLPATMPPDPYAVLCQDAGGISPSGFKFRLSDFGNVVEQEPNDTAAQATKGPALPIALNGVIEKPGDVDYFRFTAKKGETFDVRCYARRWDSALDPVMVLSNAAGGDLVGTNPTVPDCYFRYTFPEDKEYVIRVYDHLQKGSVNSFYRIEFTPVQPKLTVTIPKVDFFGYGQERQTIPVHRGNRWAVLATATRADFGGDLTLGTENLPKGVAAQSDVMVANLNQQPMVFEAAPDAPVGGTLGEITAAHIDPKTGIRSRFEQTVFMVAIPNQGVYWKHDLAKAALAVADEVPFRITVVEPKVPLVQNGSMNIKVVAERKAPFKGPITVYPLFNPPGVGSSNAVTIAENQTEAMFFVNANGGAQVRKWKTALIATADFGKGPAWVSSQLFTLEVAPPMVQIAMERAATEQGKPTQMFCKVTTTTPFPGAAKVKLIGVPANTTCPDVEFTQDAKEFAFNIGTAATTPAGIHRNLFCQVVITVNGEPILHNVGSSEFRVDVPLAPKPNAPPPAAAPKVAAAPPAANQPPPKRLTRLEQLRLEQEEREKAMKAGGTPALAAPSPKK
ncbi:MAG: PPC domain-containing protein [Gemmataceae bacterium]